MGSKDIFVNIDKKGINIGYKVIYKDESGMFSAYMPGFDIYYSAPTEEEVAKRASEIVKSFTDFWIKQNSFKDFFLQLHKLGFRTKLHNLFMKKALLIVARPLTR